MRPERLKSEFSCTLFKISYLSILFIWVLAVSKNFKGRMLFKTT